MLDQVKQLVSTARAGQIAMDELVDAVRREFIIETLRANKGIQGRAAAQLKMHRNTFTRTVHQLNVKYQEIRQELTPAKKKPQRVRASMFIYVRNRK